MDTVMRAVPEAEPVSRVFLPPRSEYREGQRLREGGWVTVQGLDAEAEDHREARRLGCDHILIDGSIRPVD
jgi:hypothetical protein